MASIEERARQLLQLADDSPTDVLHLLVTNLEAWAAQAQEILGPTSTRDIIMSEVRSTLTVCDQLQVSLDMLAQVARENAERYLGGGS